MQYEYKGVAFTCDTDIDESEAQAYVEQFLEKHPDLRSLDVEIDGDYANVHYKLSDKPPFERIRRITGYLVGTLDRFNDAKRAEESERVKHSISASS